jgi:hypothetical protein
MKMKIDVFTRFSQKIIILLYFCKEHYTSLYSRISFSTAILYIHGQHLYVDFSAVDRWVNNVRLGMCKKKSEPLLQNLPGFEPSQPIRFKFNCQFNKVMVFENLSQICTLSPKKYNF